jgi:cytidylate kinase
MPVIAMTQEMGSLGKDVALQLADAMGLAVLRDEVAEHIADKMHVSKSLISRLREGKAGFVERRTTDQRSVAVYTAEEVYTLAERGNVVIRGWGSTLLLRAVPHVVCVRVTRSFDKRVEWLKDKLGTTDTDFASDEVRRSDEAHAARMKQVFGVHWGDAVLYDIVLNTDRISIDSCVEQIRQLAGRPEFAETPASRAKLANLTLEAHVRSALKADPSTRETNVTIEADAGRVTLAGILLHAGEKDAVAQVAAAVPGVAAVDDRLRVMAGTKLFPQVR